MNQAKYSWPCHWSQFILVLCSHSSSVCLHDLTKVISELLSTWPFGRWLVPEDGTNQTNVQVHEKKNSRKIAGHTQKKSCYCLTRFPSQNLMRCIIYTSCDDDGLVWSFGLRKSGIWGTWYLIGSLVVIESWTWTHKSLL